MFIFIKRLLIAIPILLFTTSSYGEVSRNQVSNEVYGVSWNGVTFIAPSKNAVYDKIESLPSGGGGSSGLDSLTGYSTTKVLEVGGIGGTNISGNSASFNTVVASRIYAQDYLGTGGTVTGNTILGNTIDTTGLGTFGSAYVTGATTLNNGYVYITGTNSFFRGNLSLTNGGVAAGNARIVLSNNGGISLSTLSSASAGIGWTTGTAGSGTNDLGIMRSDAGVLEVNDGITLGAFRSIIVDDLTAKGNVDVLGTGYFNGTLGAGGTVSANSASFNTIAPVSTNTILVAGAYTLPPYNPTSGTRMVLWNDGAGSCSWNTVVASGGGGGGSAPYTNACVTFGFNAGNSPLTTGDTVRVCAPYAGTITKWEVLSDVQGQIQFNTEKCTYANFDTYTAVDGAAPVHISNTKKDTEAAVGWTTGVTAGDYFRSTIESIDRVTGCTVTLFITRSS